VANVEIKIKFVDGAAAASANKFKGEVEGLNKSVKNLNVNLSSTSSFLKNFAANVASDAVGALTRSIIGFGKGSVEAIKSIETINTQFEVLTGSAAKAGDLVKDLTDFAARTPFQLQGISDAASRLLSFGFSVEEVKDRMQDLGDVAAASNSDLGEVALIFGQVRAAGKLTGERLLQLQERAIPIGPALAKSLGVAESAVRDLVTKGVVSFDIFEDAFRSLNEEGGIAFGGMEKQSKTLAGRLSTLDDSITLLQASVGSDLAPAFKAGASALTAFIESIQNDKGIRAFIVDIADSIPAAFRAVSQSLIFVNDSFQNTRQVLNSLRAAFNATASGAIGAAIALNEAEIATKAFLGINTKNLEKQNAALQELRDTFDEVGVEAIESNNKIEKSQQKVEEFVSKSTGNLIKTYNDERAALKGVAEESEDSAQKQIDVETKKRDILTLLRESDKIARDEAVAEADAFAEAQASKEFAFLVENLGEQEAARVAAQAKRLENEGKTNEALNALGEARIKAIEEQNKIKKKHDEQALSDQRRFLSTASTLQQSSNKALNAIGKAAAITQVAIDTEAAISSAFAFGTRIGGPTVGFTFASIAAAAQAATAARIAGISFEDGGIVPGNSFSGDNVVARVNSGEMILNRQQQAQLFEQANGAASGSRQEIVVNTTVNLDGEVVGRSVSRQVANGLKLGEVV